MERKRLPIFAERFRELRGDMSQDEFATYLGISRPTVGFYENGNRLPDALILRQIAAKCDVSCDWLVGISNTKDLNGEIAQVCRYTGLSRHTIERMQSRAESDCTLSLQLVDNIFKGTVFRFEDYAFKTVMAEIQAEKATREVPSMKARTDALVEDAVYKDAGSADWAVKISAHDASLLYRDRAIAQIRNVARETLAVYRREVRESVERFQSEVRQREEVGDHATP